jgi:hypothetical protein
MAINSSMATARRLMCVEAAAVPNDFITDHFGPHKD